MDDNEEKIPKIFISYSHDTPAHKKWVGELASKLVNNRIDVILDQWALGLGDDLPKFMERAVTESDRVLMICTDAYVKKANDGIGGAGYETMIVTGELVQDLGTSKFIPVIRQKSKNCILPKSVATRVYVNFNEDQNFDEQFELLLKELHQIPELPKPPLGENLFKKKIHSNVDIIKIPDLNELNNNINLIYNTALDLARRNDIVARRKIIRKAKKPISEQISEWRTKYEKNVPPKKEPLLEMAAEGISIYAPLFSIALAGIETGSDKFNNQGALLDDILHPKQWNWGGYTTIVYLPEAVAFIYQALHGAICLQTDQLTLAIKLARMKFEPHNQNITLPLYQILSIIGYPETLGGDCSLAWDILIKLHSKWKWLEEIFGDLDDFRSAICSYYMALHILEFAENIAAEKKETVMMNNFQSNIPPLFLTMGTEVSRRAYHFLLNNSEQVKGIWRNLNLNDSKAKALWPSWINNTMQMLRSSYHLGFRIRIVHSDLFNDLEI